METTGQVQDERSIRVDRRGPVGWLIIHNPARMNAMSFSMWGALKRGVEELEQDPDISVIVVAGHGGKAFCAGGDISEFATVRTGRELAATYDLAARGAMAALNNTLKPTIAMIEGYCLGGGMSLASQCDLRIAADTARLGIPAAQRGAAYSFEGVQQLVALIGPSHTMNILYTGRQFDGVEAAAMGLVTEVHPAGTLGATVATIAATIARNAPLSVRAAKIIVKTAMHDPARRDLAACKAAELACLESEDYQEATRAFTEKRPPVFKGR